MLRVLFVAVFFAVAGAASAQDGLRSASLPERTPMNPIPPLRTDLFIAGPDTYRPSPPRPAQLPVFPGSGFWPTFSPWFPYPSAATQDTNSMLPGWTNTSQGPEMEWREPEPPAPEIQLPPYKPGTPGPPKTFYVIPGCYAGDKPPSEGSLPAGCDVDTMKIVPPGGR